MCAYRLKNVKVVHVIPDVFFFFFNTPSNEDVANCTFLCDDPVLVHEKRIQRLVYAVVLMGQSAICEKRGNKP